MLSGLRSRVRNWIASNVGEVHRVRGLMVVLENTRADIRSDAVLARFDEAIALIERYQPWRLAHIQRDVSRVSIVRYPCRGAYIPATRTIVTELTFLARRDITAAPVASSILHEGMHARMHRMGVHHSALTMPGIERVCRRAELEFGRALPPELGAPVIARALETMAMEDHEVAPDIDWAEATRRQREIDAR